MVVEGRKKGSEGGGRDDMGKGFLAEGHLLSEGALRPRNGAVGRSPRVAGAMIPVPQGHRTAFTPPSLPLRGSFRPSCDLRTRQIPIPRLTPIPS